MPKKLLLTRLHNSFGLAIERLEAWAENPWRRFSLLLIGCLTSFLLGSALGTINGVLALMDPVGAFITVLVLEIMVRIRRQWSLNSRNKITCLLLDFSRIGLLYGLLLEGFKLLG